MSKISRIKSTFEELKKDNKKGLITFITAGDPNFDLSLEILKKLPSSGADILEIGMPFTDPMADGPSIQASYLRALKEGQTLNKTIKLVEIFRESNKSTPIVLMGYYNPIYKYGVKKFLFDIKKVGIDGLIIVDLPPEADEEVCIPSNKIGIDFIRLATPTSSITRLPAIIKNASGFLYYVSVLGITGSKTPEINSIKKNVEIIKSFSEIPVAVGFGIKTPIQAASIAQTSDAIVVGSAIIEKIYDTHKKNHSNELFVIEEVSNFVESLSNAISSNN
ncbi:MAG: tryptophan synthase subunit alpha [Pelagibacterales bacterium]|nr:tryptophan synthase subunit alpha [Pelagibacterales bacterium]OUV27888.1 MAG: tryptophan synthase subunit alpha [Alphaproteobacteria bacterium TMED109]RCL82778.1 MAG: tryptophan synthase subunit alpha [Alphaproteobacteria bacterium]